MGRRRDVWGAGRRCGPQTEGVRHRCDVWVMGRTGHRSQAEDAGHCVQGTG